MPVIQGTKKGKAKMKGSRLQKCSAGKKYIYVHIYICVRLSLYIRRNDNRNAIYRYIGTAEKRASWTPSDPLLHTSAQDTPRSQRPWE